MNTPITPPVSQESIASPWGQAVSAQLNGIQTKRIAVAALAAGQNVDVTVTWGRPFADANYTVALTLVNDTNSTQYITSVNPAGRGRQTAASIVVAVRNNHASLTIGPMTLNAIAVHD